jgi:hypothetical protein
MPSVTIMLEIGPKEDFTLTPSAALSLGDTTTGIDVTVETFGGLDLSTVTVDNVSASSGLAGKVSIT